MEKKLADRYDKDYMKMALLKHEEIFREQVYELHRLYKIQQHIMRDIAKNKRCNNKDPHYSTIHSNPQARKLISLDLERPLHHHHHHHEESDELEDLELTLGSRSYHSQRKINNNLRSTVQSEYSGPSMSSSSTSSRDQESSSSKQKSWDFDLHLQKQGRSSMGHHHHHNNNHSSRPPWLLKASLNMT